MKKSVLITIVFIACFNYSSNSQILIGIIFGDKVNSDYLQMGFSVGDNLTTLSNIEGNKYAHNLALGLDLKVFPKNKLSLHTGAFFSAPASKSGLPIGPLDDPYLDSVFMDTNVELKLSYLSLPVYAKYNVGKSFFVEAGTTLAYLRKAKLDHIYEKDDKSVNYTEQIKGEFKKWDIQAGLGFGFAFKEGAGTHINIRYVQGLVDILENNSRKSNPSKSTYNQGFQFLVEIPIKGDSEL